LKYSSYTSTEEDNEVVMHINSFDISDSHR